MILASERKLVTPLLALY